MEKLFYTTVSQHHEHEIPKIKGSRFIGNIFPIQNKEEAEKHLKEIQKKYQDATHNCYAYRYGSKVNYDLFGTLEITPEQSKQDDDGEPASTAGRPILAQIQGHKLHNVLIIVTRYFGGTMLGVGGLIQAYSDAAKQVIEHAQLQETEIMKTIQFSCSFETLPTIRHLFNKFQAKISKEDYDENVTMELNINSGYLAQFKQELFDQSKGQIII